jgi:hypothetical protein
MRSKRCNLARSTLPSDDDLERDYSRRRAVVERLCAQQAPTEEIKHLHLALALKYEAFAEETRP